MAIHSNAEIWVSNPSSHRVRESPKKARIRRKVDESWNDVENVGARAGEEIYGQDKRELNEKILEN